MSATTPTAKSLAGGSPKVADSPGDGSAKKVLSSKISSMRFMQRKAEADAAKRELDGPGDQAPSEAEHGGGGVRKVTVVDGVGNPVIKYCPGRRSFLRYNVTVEDHATLQLKEFNRFRKALGGQLRGPWMGGGGAPPPTGKVKQEGADVNDAEMAAALGKRRRGVDGEEGQKGNKNKVK